MAIKNELRDVITDFIHYISRNTTQSEYNMDYVLTVYKSDIVPINKDTVYRLKWDQSVVYLPFIVEGRRIDWRND